MNDISIKYYEIHADEFVASTLNANMSSLYSEFEKYLPAKCRILDLGCGSGRDSRYFFEKGYEVVAVDPSLAMCEKTREIVNVPVTQKRAEELDFKNEFDAIWACASLLHVSRENQYIALQAIVKALKENGVAYCSWKYGNVERREGDREFTDMDEALVKELVGQFSELELLKIWDTVDVREDRMSQEWLNVLVKKKNMG